MLKLKLQYFGHLMRRANSFKRPWCWERLRAGGEGDNRGWGGWMTSLTQWTWVWVNSGSWWWTGRPGVVWFMELQRVRHDRATELNWSIWGSFFVLLLKRAILDYINPSMQLFFFLTWYGVKKKKKKTCMTTSLLPKRMSWYICFLVSVILVSVISLRCCTNENFSPSESNCVDLNSGFLTSYLVTLAHLFTLSVLLFFHV